MVAVGVGLESLLGLFRAPDYGEDILVVTTPPAAADPAFWIVRGEAWGVKGAASGIEGCLWPWGQLLSAQQHSCGL